MKTENVSTFKINRLTQEQYDNALADGSINDNELYMTPDDNELDTSLFLRASDAGSAVDPNPINADTINGKSASDFATPDDISNLSNTLSNAVGDINSTMSSLTTEVNKKAPLASPSFTGAPKVAAGTDYTTARIRNITLSTADPSGGSNGDIWIKYTN